MIDGIKAPAEESIACYMYGFVRNAGMFYKCHEGGDLSDSAAQKKLIQNCTLFAEKVTTEYFKTLTKVDVDEIWWEIDWSIKLEHWTWRFYKLAIKGDYEMIPVANRPRPVRPFTEEMYMSYIVGMMWFIYSNTPNRNQVIQDFILAAKKHLAPNMERERAIELDYWYNNDNRLEEIMTSAYDIFDMRYCRTGKKSESKN